MLARFLPATLLVVVALTQIALWRAVDMTPWKGGGFGMFATLDHGAFRGVQVVVEAPDRSETLDIPPSLDEIAARVATCPSDWLLRQLAEGVVARERRYERTVSRVMITPWRVDFAPATLTANERPLRTFHYAVE